MSNAFITRMPAGIAGDVTRREHADIEPQVMDTDYPVLRYGEPVKMVDGKIRPITTDDDIDDIYGFGCRAYPIQTSSNEALGTGTPPTNLHFDVLRRGYMTVKVQDGTPVKNASVFVRTVAASDPVAQPIGGLECDSDGGDCFEITNAKFMGEADSDGNVEISYNL
ncbi:MAG TPA: hypothetical protein P5214_08750 [Rectinema sp.]|nr:hypothetical protein [Rectinema sp.]